MFFLILSVAEIISWQTRSPESGKLKGLAMLKTVYRLISIAALSLGILSCESGLYRSTGGSGSAKPFGNEADLSYAARLWDSMHQQRLVGSDSIRSTPYEGTHPHGAILDTMDTIMTIAGHTGELIIKKNFGGPEISKEAVANDPDTYLKAVTVMYRRESGYDAENKNWFWVKYAPDGAVMKNPKGMSLAGRVAKGMDQGCIACHGAAPGGDMVFNHNRYQ